MTEQVIHVNGLSHRYGKTDALNGASFHVPRGSVTGLLGPNGSGKTTAIHILIGILRRSGGDVTVLGMDPERDAVAIRGRIGFVPEDPHGEPLFTVNSQLNFLKAFYPSWDDALQQQMLEQLDLDPGKKVKSLSRGERSKLALIGAMSHRPELLVLDDPTLGLDPMARREFMEGMIAVLAEEGRTVFFSTHHMQDIEKVADRVIMVNNGRTIFEDELDTIKSNWRCYRLTFDGEEAPAELKLPGLMRWIPEGRAGRAIFENFIDESTAAMNQAASSVEALPFDLEDIFVESAARERNVK